MVGVCRFGTRVRGRPLPGGWLALSCGDRYIRLNCPELGALLSHSKPRELPSAVTAGRGALTMASTPIGVEEAGRAALEAAAALRERAEEVEMEELARVEVAIESEAQRKAAEAAYIEAGCRDAVILMQHPSMQSLYQCHLAGGLLLALDLACTLLGARATKPVPSWKRAKEATHSRHPPPHPPRQLRCCPPHRPRRYPPRRPRRYPPYRPRPCPPRRPRR